MTFNVGVDAALFNHRIYLNWDYYYRDTEVLGWILDERRRELVHVGLRLYDQKRLNLEPAFAKALTRTVAGPASAWTARCSPTMP